MKRRDLLAAAGATGLALGSMTRTARAATRARTLKFVPQSDLSVIDPLGAPAYVTRNHALMVFDTLYGVDDNLYAKPQMAAGHVVENDGLVWRITLRDGLKFHDGEPVLARDVVASIQRWGKRDIYAGALMAVTRDIVATSDSTLEFRLSKPFRQLPDVLGKVGSNVSAIMPERLARTDPFTPVPELVGSGPYRYVAQERNAGALNVYERFDGYRPRQEPANYLSGGKVVHFDRVEWHTIPDPSTAAAALQSGEVDWWEQPTSELVTLLRKVPQIEVRVNDPAGYAGLMRFNCLQPPFDNPAMRRAFWGALNQADYMIAVAGEDPAMWKDHMGYFHPDSPMASTVGFEYFSAKPSPDQARQALQAAGYKNERVVMIATADYPTINITSEIAADMLKRAGVNLVLEVQDWATVSTRMQSKAPSDKGGWNVLCNFTAGAGMYNPAAHTWLRSNGERAFVGWPDIPRIEELRAQWFEAADVPSQQRLCQEIQRVAFDQVPYVPLGFYYQPTAFRKDIVDVLKGVPLFYNVRRA